MAMGDKNVFVIGQQMADARRKEEERLAASGAEKSPLAGLSYDKWAGDFDLTDPKRVPLDDELAAFCRGFSTSEAGTRQHFRRSIGMDEFYTLLTFARRSAVFALRARDVSHIEDGLAAVAIIDPSRVDFRDAVVAISLLDHASRAIGAADRGPFIFAASVADEVMAQRMLEFVELPPSERDIRTMSGYVQVDADTGPGFMNWNLAPYRPTCRLDRVALAVARLVAADAYQPSSITLASDLPRVWFSQHDRLALTNALRSIRAGALVHADLRPSDAYDNRNQSLMAFIVEVKSEHFAHDLYRIAQQTITMARPFASTAVTAGRLFSLVVARSFVLGTANHETDASLQRFTVGLTRILEGG